MRQYTTCAVFKSVSKITCTRNSRKNLFSVNLSRAGTKFERCKPAQEVWSIEVPGRSGRLRFLLLLKFGNCGNLWKWIGLDLRLSWPVARLSGSITNAQPSIGQLHFASNAIVMDLCRKRYPNQDLRFYYN